MSRLTDWMTGRDRNAGLRMYGPGPDGAGEGVLIDPDALWTDEAVDAFRSLVLDNPDRTREIVRGMSGRDRAVLLFNAGELSRLVSEEEMFRTDEDRRSARQALRDADGGQ